MIPTGSSLRPIFGRAQPCIGMVLPTDVTVLESTPQIDAAGFVAEHFPPHVHGENCPACVLADLPGLVVCCEQ